MAKIMPRTMATATTRHAAAALMAGTADGVNIADGLFHLQAVVAAEAFLRQRRNKA